MTNGFQPLAKCVDGRAGAGQDVHGALLGWASAMGLPPSVCDHVSSAWRTDLYRRGDVVFHQKDVPTGVYFICKGRVKLVRRGPSEHQHILRIVTGPDFLGERALIAGQPYAASAQVIEDSLICVLEGERFFELWRREPEIARAFVRNLVRKLDAVDNAIVAEHPCRAWKNNVLWPMKHGMSGFSPRSCSEDYKRSHRYEYK